MSMDMDDYHKYMMICGEDESEGSGSGGSSSSSGSGCFTWILIVLAILWIIGKLSS